MLKFAQKFGGYLRLPMVRPHLYSSFYPLMLVGSLSVTVLGELAGLSTVNLASAKTMIPPSLSLNQSSVHNPSPFSNQFLISQSADDYFSSGLEKYEQGDLSGAIADYTQAIRLKPNYADAYYNRGIVKSDIEDLTGAIVDYSEAIRIKPSYPEAFLNRGNVKDDLGDITGAIRDYSQAIRIKPDYGIAYYNRGISQNKLKKSRAALADYNETIRLDPEYVNAYYNRGNAYELLNDTPKAIADFQIAALLYRKNGDTTWLNKSRQRIQSLEQNATQSPKKK